MIKKEHKNKDNTATCYAVIVRHPDEDRFVDIKYSYSNGDGEENRVVKPLAIFTNKQDAETVAKDIQKYHPDREY